MGRAAHCRAQHSSVAFTATLKFMESLPPATIGSFSFVHVLAPINTSGPFRVLQPCDGSVNL